MDPGELEFEDEFGTMPVSDGQRAVPPAGFSTEPEIGAPLPGWRRARRSRASI